MKRVIKHLYLLAIMVCGVTYAAPDYQNPQLPIEKRVEDLLSRMTLDEKVDYVSGMRIGGHTKNQWDGPKGNERLGILPVKIYHGPYGIGASRYVGKNGTYYPSSISMATTWNRDLITEVTTSLSKELTAAGGQSSAGPSMNIIRDLRSGRSMEYFTEDPYLNGQIAAAYTIGVQSQKNFAIMKHFVCNNQEMYRNTIDVTVGERALREIYLPGYKVCVDVGIMGVMTGYNTVNGMHNSAYKHLIQDVLKDEWGFKGVVMTDWSGSAKSVKAMVDAGIDLEMPRPKTYSKGAILSAIKRGEITEEQINEKVRRILYLTFWSGVMDKAPSYNVDQIGTPESVELARVAAEQSLVLLQNEGNLLPFDREKVKTVAVIGPNGEFGKHFQKGAKSYQMLQGGGSASIVPKYGMLITPYAGIKNAAGSAEVRFEPGCYGEQGCTPITENFFESKSGEPGLDAVYYNTKTYSGKSTEKIDKKIEFTWTKSPLILEEGNTAFNSNRDFSVVWSGKIVAPTTRDYTFEMMVTGEAQLSINGKVIAKHSAVQRSVQYVMVTLPLTAGKHDIEVRYNNCRASDRFKLAWDYGNDEYLNKAVELARNSDVVVMAVGTSGFLESESTDRAQKINKSDCLALSACQEKLIKEVAKVNKNVVVVTYTAGVVCEEWKSDVASIIYAGFPGQEGANALGRVIFGDVNPSGHLSVTIPKSCDQYPKDWHSRIETVDYSEGIFVGYRYFDKYKKEAAFPFGHGLSYTTFDYSNLKVTKSGDKVKVSVTVTNSGKRLGREVVQLYVGDVKCSEARPSKELKEFAKVEIAPSESKVVEFTLDNRAFQFFSEKKNKWVVEKGEFKIMLGSSIEDIKCSKSINL